MWDVDNLPTFIEQLSAQNFSPLSITFNQLVHYTNHGVGGSRYECGPGVHAHILDLLQADGWEIDAVG